MFYVAHRLFSLHDRVLGARVAERLATSVGHDAVFLPFCDTDEEDLAAAEKGKALYELDRARLRTMRGMLAILHGPSLDDGVCMEIGFAARIGVPVVVLTTDFQTFGTLDDPNEMQFPDPLIEVVSTAVVRIAALSPLTDDSPASRFADFRNRNELSLEYAIDRAVEVLLSCVPPSPPDAVVTASLSHVFWDPSPYGGITDLLEDVEFPVVTASRMQALRTSGVAAARSAAVDDWQHACRAQAIAVDLDGPEAPAGAAVLVGCGRAQGSELWGRYRAPLVTYAPGREANRRNLMVHYAIDKWI